MFARIFATTTVIATLTSGLALGKVEKALCGVVRSDGSICQRLSGDNPAKDCRELGGKWDPKKKCCEINGVGG
ncbi:hypothetical protein CAL7716_065800 [Calothrix sp. PCC 7716]|nr:hypothetical protein CAL7716_065800 [Calothrix sp. PCC 7716]